MPTTRPRHQVTETDEIAAAVEAGLQEWPNLSRSDIIRELILKGAESLKLTAVERVLAAELALKQLEELDIEYPPDYLEELRRGWGRYD